MRLRILYLFEPGFVHIGAFFFSPSCAPPTTWNNNVRLLPCAFCLLVLSSARYFLPLVLNLLSCLLPALLCLRPRLLRLCPVNCALYLMQAPSTTPVALVPLPFVCRRCLVSCAVYLAPCAGCAGVGARNSQLLRLCLAPCACSWCLIVAE